MSVTCRQCGRRNVDGAQFCADAQCGAYLGWDAEHTTAQPDPRPDPRTAPQRVGIWGELSETELAVAPGESGTTTLTLHNTGTLVEGVAVTVVGPAASWSTVEPAQLSVYPDKTASCTVRFAPPRGPAAPAGHTWFEIRCASTVHSGLVATVLGAVVVGQIRELTAQLTPTVTRGRRRTRHQVRLDNRGNALERVRLTAVDAEGVLTMDPADTQVDVPPGRTDVPLSVRAPLRWFGRPRAIPIQATVAPYSGSPPIRTDGTRHVLPVLPTWPLAAALTALLLLGGGTAAVKLAGDREAALSPDAAAASVSQTESPSDGDGSPTSAPATTAQQATAPPPSSTVKTSATTPPTTVPTTTQPKVPPPVEPPIPGEDCIPYNPNNLHLVDKGSIGWQLLEGSSHAMLLLDNQTDAQKALALAGRHTKMCFFGRNNSRTNRADYIVYYWRGSSEQQTTIPAEDCIPYDPAALRVVNAGTIGWQLMEGASHAMLLLDTETDAKNALTWAKAFTKECFIGRDNQRTDRSKYIVGYWLH